MIGYSAQQLETFGSLLKQRRRIREKRELEASFSSFCRSAWQIIEPETVLCWGFHFDYLCEWLTLISAGDFKKLYPDKLGLIINVPPRTGKSTFVTICWPVWTWLVHPSRRFLFGSHSYKLSVDHNSKRRDLITSAWFQERCGERFQLARDGSTLVRNDKTGQFLVTSIGAKQTGFGGQIIVADDLLDRADARSTAVKTATNEWLDTSWSKLRDNPATDVFVHISQRLSVDDPTGHVLGEDGTTGKPSDWIRIKIKREAEEDETYVFPISKSIHQRPKGDILQPDRCTPIVLSQLKSKSREWANQEQQEPTPTTGAILNPNWLRWYRGSTPQPAFFQVVVSVDCTFKASNDSDYAAIHKYALVYKRRILLDRRMERLGYVATKQAIKEMARGGHAVPWLSVPMPAATHCLIENKANGPAVTEELRADPEFPLIVIEYNPVGSKDQRFYAATGDAEAGLIYFPEDAPWIGEVRKQLTDFAGEGSIPHDDDCDAWSQFVNWSRQKQYGLLGYLEAQAEEARVQQEEVYRCLITDTNGHEFFVVWDPRRELWVGPNGETYQQGPADEGGSNSSGQEGSAGAAAADAAGDADEAGNSQGEGEGKD